MKETSRTPPHAPRAPRSAPLAAEGADAGGNGGNGDGHPGRLVRVTAVDMVVADLRKRILSGAIAPGSALRQEALADELGVSRIPLREAIRLLSSEGLVDLQPHRGAYVSMLSVDEVREFFDLRLRLEPWLLQEACPAISEAELQRGMGLVDAMDRAGAEDWGRLNWQLHELLYRPAQRPFALNIVRTLHEKSERYFRFQMVNVPIRRQAHDEHVDIITLCRHRQADAARAAMEHHIADAAMQIIEAASRLLDDAKKNA
jgi:DNA-binding GntR family transcriptional regulator